MSLALAALTLTLAGPAPAATVTIPCDQAQRVRSSLARQEAAIYRTAIRRQGGRMTPAQEARADAIKARSRAIRAACYGA